MSTIPTSEMDALKARLRSLWMDGDFGVIARMVEEVNEQIVERLDLRRGTKVLDVACGTGNSAIPAARRGAEVIGIDIAPNLIAQARARAKEAGVDARFEEGDAEQIAYPDASFDVVITVFGAMFGPRPDLVASELKRVCRPGGRIVMGNWTPGGFAGQMFKLGGKYVPPPPGMAPPVQWGDEAIVRERFRDGVSELKFTRRMATMQNPGDEKAMVALFRRYFGPVKRIFDALDAPGQEAYARDLEALWKEANRATDGSVRVESELLEVTATRST